MSEILTPDEIAALSEAFASDAAGAHRREPLAPVRRVDLTNQERALEGQLPGLELVLGRFGRGLRAALATSFGELPSVTTATVGLVRFERLTARLAEPAGLLRFRLSPLRGHGVVAIPASLVGALLQVACGGAPGQAGLPAREFSAVEVRLLERFGSRVLAELRSAWEPVAALDCGLASVETNPLFAKVAAPEELVLHVELTVVVPGVVPWPITLVVPNGSLDPIRARLQTVHETQDGASIAADAGWRARLTDRLLDVAVDVVVELGTARLALSRLLELRTGDLVPLDTGRDGPVVVRVAGTPQFHGAPGVQGRNNAVRITERI
jgi:flagellar motor switch protein FliM